MIVTISNSSRKNLDHFDERILSAHESGIDENLIELNLSLTPEERIRRHDEAAQLAEELRIAGQRWLDEKPR